MVKEDSGPTGARGDERTGPAAGSARALDGSRDLALARRLTALERGEAERGELPAGDPERGVTAARRVVVTGPPGVGKSSLVAALAEEITGADESIGVLAVDPRSETSGGAFLGDRVRLASLADRPGLFVRSVAPRISSAGRSAAQADDLVVAMADAIAASGRDWVFVETAGIGQLAGVDPRLGVCVLVVSPASGDEMQLLKAGILERAELFVVQQIDSPGARAWARRFREIEDTGEQREILEVSARTREGVPALLAALRRATSQEVPVE